MDRRRFLTLGGASIATIPLLTFPTISCSQKKNIAPLLVEFMTSETIAIIGKEYFTNAPSINYELYSQLSRMEAADMIQRDFEEDRVVIVSGWVLSITEARQCAAYHKQR